MIVKDANDLLSGPKITCMLEKEPLTHMILTSPVRNTIWKIYENTRLKPGMDKEREIVQNPDRCLISEKSRLTKLMSSNVVFVGEKTSGNLLMSASFLFAGMFNKWWVTEKNTEGVEGYNQVIYLNGKKPSLARM